MTRNYYKK